MNSKFLPSLISIQINNFSLFPGDLNFRYNFIEGVNLVIGGNGIGKTTFLNIIKYALIGLYKKGTDVKRREYKGVEYRYEKRVNLPYNYFYNRMDSFANYNEEAEVILTFRIGTSIIEVTRSLFLPAVIRVKIEQSGKVHELTGKIISQNEFDNLYSNRDKNVDFLNDTLQMQYETKLGELSGHDNFDNLIFLINDVLFFSEHRDNIMWDGYFQEKFSSIYFIEPSLLKELDKHQLDSKYYDSLSRHKSEDIRAIRKIFERINDNDTANKSFKDLIAEIDNLKKSVDSKYVQLKNVQAERDQKEVNIKKLHTEKNLISRNLDKLETSKRNEEQTIFSNIFKKLTPKYVDYMKFIKNTGGCPLCNNELPSPIVRRIVSEEETCMLCGHSIIHPQLLSNKLTEIKARISDVQIALRNNEREIVRNEEDLAELDNRFKEINRSLSNTQSDLRKAEFAIQRFQTENAGKTDSEFLAMKAQIEELEKEKDEASQKSKEANDKTDEILELIDSQRLESTGKLSEMFSRFGNKFLGVPCELVYEDPKDEQGKRYLPRINMIDRYNEEELSESQRFFIDQSFRMSLLNFFNKSSSFFMCETPDSSLDISYERNAAKVYLEYIRQPNALIITSNLNNSEFLEYLIESAVNINFINLLKIGKQSSIQSNSAELFAASDKIEKLINGKKYK